MILALLRPAFKEQCLADHRRHHRWLIGFGNQERRLWADPGQQPFRISGDEDDRNLERVEQVVDRVNARAAVGELDVGENEPWLLLPRERDRLLARARYPL